MMLTLVSQKTEYLIPSTSNSCALTPATASNSTASKAKRFVKKLMILKFLVVRNPSDVNK